ERGEIDHRFARQRSDHTLAQPRRVGRLGMSHQMPLSRQEHAESEQHADAGGAEAVAPAKPLSEPAADETREHRADVDAGIEDGEAGVAPRIVAGVELADDGGDVRLEKTDADDDQREREMEDLQ